jgi:hypothetical protein
MIQSSFQSGFDRSLADLAAALAANDPERICPAYRAAKGLWTGTVPGLLERIEQSCGRGSGESIVHAFSRLHCYMCQDGASSCPSCEGAGGDCSACDGLGMEVCGFCGGTGWADEEMIPPEFRPAVRHQHVNAALKQAQKLAEIRDAAHFAALARQLPRAKKTEIGLWLLRLKCRFDALARQATDRKQIQHQVLAKHAGKLLNALAGARI